MYVLYSIALYNAITPYIPIPKGRGFTALFGNESRTNGLEYAHYVRTSRWFVLIYCVC